MIKFFVAALSDGEGNVSSTRLIAFISAMCVLSVWTLNSYHNGTLAPVSVEQLGLALGPLGFKVLQKGKETAPAAPAAPAAA